LSSWEKILAEIEKIAEHHNQFADKLENDIAKNISNFVKEQQKVRKKVHSQ
jgi:hypothetical protein